MILLICFSSAFSLLTILNSNYVAIRIPKLSLNLLYSLSSLLFFPHFNLFNLIFWGISSVLFYKFLKYIVYLFKISEIIVKNIRVFRSRWQSQNTLCSPALRKSSGLQLNYRTTIIRPSWSLPKQKSCDIQKKLCQDW